MVIPPYPNIAVRDVILVKWGKASLDPHIVSADEAAGTTPIVITIHKDKIVAGGDGDGLVVDYDIHDEVLNYSEKRSQSTTVNVMSGERLLDEPIIQDSKNGTLYLGELEDRDASVEVHASGSPFKRGDTITMNWEGTTQTGETLPNQQSKILENLPSNLKFQIPNAQVRALEMGSAKASYVLYDKENGTGLSSRHGLAQVKPGVPRVPAPVLKEASNGKVNADITSATVDIQYPGMAAGETVNMAWLGTKANGNPYLYEAQHIVSPDDVKNLLVTLHVPGKHLRVLKNGTLNLFYRVSGDESKWRGLNESGHQQIEVLQFT